MELPLCDASKKVDVCISVTSIDPPVRRAFARINTSGVARMHVPGAGKQCTNRMSELNGFLFLSLGRSMLPVVPLISTQVVRGGKCPTKTSEQLKGRSIQHLVSKTQLTAALPY